MSRAERSAREGRLLKLKAFEQVAAEAFDAIPQKYREGVDGLVISPESLAHPTMPDIYTLGRCDTEAYLSEWDGPDTVRSVVRLYYGSFRALAASDPDFDWEAEIHETIQHEVRHHLESLAREDQLGGVDYAMDEGFRRADGRPFDPWFYQYGEPAGGGVYVVESQVYLEQIWSESDYAQARDLSFRWGRQRYRVEKPLELGDVTFVWIRSGVSDPPEYLELVLVRRRSWWEDARRLFQSSRPRVIETEADARPDPGGG